MQNQRSTAVLAIRSRHLACALLAIIAVIASPGLSADDKAEDGRPVVKDEESGLVVAVKSDSRTLVATNAEEKVVWEVDVIKQAGEPDVGAPIVRSLALTNQQVTAIYGKHSFAVFDLKSGKLLSRGSD